MKMKKSTLRVLAFVLALVPGALFAGSAEFKTTTGGYDYTFPVSMEARWDTLYFRPTALLQGDKNNAKERTSLSAFTRMIYQKGNSWYEVVREATTVAQYAVTVTSGSFTSNSGFSNLAGSLLLTTGDPLRQAPGASLLTLLSYGTWGGTFHNSGTSVAVTTSQPEIPIPLSQGATLYFVAEDKSALKVVLGKEFNFERSLFEYYQTLTAVPALPPRESKELRALLLSYYLYTHLSASGTTPTSQSSFLATAFPASSGIAVSQIEGPLGVLVAKLTIDSKKQRELLSPLSAYLAATLFESQKGSSVPRFPTRSEIESTSGTFYGTLAARMTGVDSRHEIVSATGTGLANMATRFFVGLDANNFNSDDFDVRAYRQWLNTPTTPATENGSQIGNEFVYPPASESILAGNYVTLVPPATGQMALRFLSTFGAAPERTYLILAPSPNLLTEAKLGNYQGIEKYLVDNSAVNTPEQSRTIPLDFHQQESLSSLLIWGNTDFKLEEVHVDGIKVDPTHFQKWSRKVTSGVVEHEAVAPTVSLSSPFLTTVNLPASGKNLSIRFSGTLFRLRAYEKDIAPSFGRYSWKRGAENLFVASLSSTQNIGGVEVFPDFGSNNLPAFFLESDSYSLPRTLKYKHEAMIEPIAYAALGIESPKSYNLKVNNNLSVPPEYLLSYGKKIKNARFALTEHDFILSSADRTVNDQLLYASGQNPDFSTGTLPRLYPYTYGVYLPVPGQAITEPASPFFVEKIAGVDSFGLLVSALKLNSMFPTAEPSTEGLLSPAMRDAWNSRTELIPLPSVPDPFSNRGSRAYYDWKKKTGSVETWLQNNSSALRLDQFPAPGDLLVGKEGTQVEVAIIVSVPATWPQDRTQWTKHIKVVAISSGLRKAVLSYWEASSSTSPAFTLNPDNYHVRRLLKVAAPLPFLWLQTGFAGSPRYAFQGPDPFLHWLPNDRKPRPLGQIVLETPAAVVDNTTWKLEAKDFSFGKSIPNWTNKNVFRNYSPNSNVHPQGNYTTFYLIASASPLPDNGREMQVASVTANSWNLSYVDNGKLVDSATVIGKVSPSGSESLTVTMDPRRNGTIQNNRLVIDGTFTEFAVLAVGSAGAPNPGDDLQLAFRYNGYSTEFGPRLAVINSEIFSLETVVSSASYERWLTWGSDEIADQEEQRRLTDRYVNHVQLRFLQAMHLGSGAQAEYIAYTLKVDEELYGKLDWAPVHEALYDSAAFVIGFAGPGGTVISMGMVVLKNPGSLSTPGGAVDLAMTSVELASSKLKSVRELSKVVGLINQTRKGVVHLKAVLPDYIWKKLGYTSKEDVPGLFMLGKEAETADALEKAYRKAFDEKFPSGVSSLSVEEVEIGVKEVFKEKFQREDFADAIKAVGKGTKSDLLAHVDAVPNGGDVGDLKAWIGGFDEIADKALINNIHSLPSEYYELLSADLKSVSQGDLFRELLRKHPEDLHSKWKLLKDSPETGWERSRESASWDQWAQTNFFKTVTKLGREFEELCRVAFGNRTSVDYLRLKDKIFKALEKDLDEYVVYSQVQLKYGKSAEDTYFVADQLFLKWKDGKIVDAIVIEDKLRAKTNLTVPQREANRWDTFAVRNNDRQHQTLQVEDPHPIFKTDNITVVGNGTIHWIKVHDGDDGKAISDFVVLK